MFSLRSLFFFFNDTATTEIYTLSLHDALPISGSSGCPLRSSNRRRPIWSARRRRAGLRRRSEEHTSELQSLAYLVCRLLLEKKKKLTCRASSRSDIQSPDDAHVARLRTACRCA